jgi:hypothetical protein
MCPLFVMRMVQTLSIRLFEEKLFLCVELPRKEENLPENFPLLLIRSTMLEWFEEAEILLPKK